MATAPPQVRSAPSPSASSLSQPRDSYFPVRCGDEDTVHCGARLPVPSCHGGVLASSPDPARAHLPLNHSIEVLAPDRPPLSSEQGVQCGRSWRAVRESLACSLRPFPFLDPMNSMPSSPFLCSLVQTGTCSAVWLMDFC